MIRRPPRSSLPYPPFPHTSLFRSAPMASDRQCNLIGRDFCVEFLGSALRLGIEVGEVEPGAPRGAGEMVAEVPVARAAPDKLGHLVAEGEALAAARGGLAEPGAIGRAHV